jgi:hypothetical protein
MLDDEAITFEAPVLLVRALEPKSKMPLDGGLVTTSQRLRGLIAPPETLSAVPATSRNLAT